jgi:hypothetical protein
VAQGSLNASFAALGILRSYLSLVLLLLITGRACAQLDANWREKDSPACRWVLVASSLRDEEIEGSIAKGDAWDILFIGVDGFDPGSGFDDTERA